MPLSLTFCYANFTLFKGKSMFTLNEGEIIDSFQQLLDDLTTLAYGSYLCELVDISMVEGESSRLLFKQLITVFYLLRNNVGDLETLLRAFEIKLLKLTGYGLNTDYCVKCRKKITNSNYLSFESYGGICPECKKSGGRQISFASFKALSYLSNLELEKVYRVKLSSEVKNEIEIILQELILQSYGKKTKSLEILKGL
jgi:DNA repair protein RecO (recombination protein O)